jgi:uncharacterized protein
LAIIQFLGFRHRQVAVLGVTLLAAWALAGCSRSRKETLDKQPAPVSKGAPVPASFDDSAQDGTPDFLRLDTEQDRAAFRHWFTFLAEVQYFNPPANRPPEIVDCSSLLRYCYRESLREHDSRWADEARLPLVPAFNSVRKYSYPYTALNAALFRIRSGPFTRLDLQNGAFAQFADAETIERFNTFRVSRDLRYAQPGDLFFFRRVRDGNRSSFHSIIFLGHSQIRSSTAEFVVYNTGPDGAKNGQMRLLSISNLLHFPDPEWRPYTSNTQFLGVFRWNILRDPT